MKKAPSSKRHLKREAGPSLWLVDGACGGSKDSSRVGEAKGRSRAAGQIEARCSHSHREDVDRAKGRTKPNQGSRSTFLFLYFIFKIYFC